MKPKNYKTIGQNVGLLIGLILFSIYTYNKYITQSSELFSYTIWLLPFVLFLYIAISMIIGKLLGGLYTKKQDGTTMK